jgi:hypothetical protein
MKSLLAGVSEHVAQRGAFGRKLKDFAAVQGTVRRGGVLGGGHGRRGRASATLLLTCSSPRLPHTHPASCTCTTQVATMAARTYGAESLAYLLAANMDRGMADYQLEVRRPGERSGVKRAAGAGWGKAPPSAPPSHRRLPALLFVCCVCAPSPQAAVSKIYASEAAWACADDAIQVRDGRGLGHAPPPPPAVRRRYAAPASPAHLCTHAPPPFHTTTAQLMGGLGYMSSLPYERLARDLRIFRIFEGSNPVLRQFIVRVWCDGHSCPHMQVRQ